MVRHLLVFLLIANRNSIIGLYLKFIGEAKSDWSTGYGRTQKYHSGNEVYIENKTYLFGGEGGKFVQVPAGIHEFNFEVLLHPLLPQSLKSKYGSIRYSIKACLDVTWSFNKTLKVGFKVSRNDDYSRVRDLTVPHVKQCEIDNKTCFFWAKGSLHASVSIPHSVFTPDSEIPITIHLDNKNNKKVDQVLIQLAQIIDHYR
jgi:hypothetical protein